MKLLIIVPAFNEELNIERVIDNLIDNYPQYDYIVINDGSSDSTSEICHKKGYHVVDLPVNLGLAGAFKTGMKYAFKNGYDYAIQLDADGQHDPAYIGAMVEEIEKGYDIVLGSRYETVKKPISARMMGSRLLTMAIKLTTGVTINDPTAGMRLYNRKMIAQFANNVDFGPEPDTVSLLVKEGASVKAVQMEMYERQAGTSYLTISRSIMYMTRMMTSILFIQNFRRKGK